MPPQAEQAQQDELPMESVSPASTTPMPEATYTAPPTTPAVPPVSRHGTYIPDTNHYKQCFIPTDGHHACSVGPAYYYLSSNSAALGTSATTSA